MNPPNREKAPSTKVKEPAFKTFLSKLKKRHIIETFVGFIAGGSFPRPEQSPAGLLLPSLTMFPLRDIKQSQIFIGL